MDAVIEDLAGQIKRRQQAIQQQTIRKGELERLLQVHNAELARLRTVEADLSAKAERVLKSRNKQSAQTAQLGHLCQW